MVDFGDLEVVLVQSDENIDTEYDILNVIHDPGVDGIDPVTLIELLVMPVGEPRPVEVPGLPDVSTITDAPSRPVAPTAEPMPTAREVAEGAFFDEPTPVQSMMEGR